MFVYVFVISKEYFINNISLNGINGIKIKYIHELQNFYSTAKKEQLKFKDLINI